jgi:nicotinate-nucleotide pyrophosphorylase (carboxylating)
MQLDLEKVKIIIIKALSEDVGEGDITSEIIIPESKRISAEFITREDCVVCGIPVLEEIFSMSSDPKIQYYPNAIEGSSAKAGQKIFTVSGKAKEILRLERTALNILQYMSGIATITRKFVDEVKHTKAKILDTRKTHPNLRVLAKYAVWIGGGTNHRNGLYDAILIKDNHLAMLGGDIKYALETANKFNNKNLKIEIEVDNLTQFEEALKYDPDVIMLDNMAIGQLKQAVEMNNNKVKLEASGGININNVKAVAETGVDFISVGAITHSSKNIDIGLDFIN